MKRAMKVIAAVLILGMFLGIPNVSAVYFSDVSTSSLDRETFDAINYVSDNGWIVGTTTTTYSPNSVLTRAMFVAILYRISGSTEKYTNNFTDVPTTAYYYDAVGWASHYGIVAGIAETQFGPNNSLTREQVFAFLFRYTTDYLGKTYSITHTIGNLADYSNISSYARTAIGWARSYHILQISDTGYAYPKSNVTRADSALFLTRFSREVIGFSASDQFGFVNHGDNFSPAYYMTTLHRERMLDSIDNYYGAGSSAADVNKTIFLSKINTSENMFSGACFGMSFSILFDKNGKLDFNKNFANASNMQSIGKPRYNHTAESAINYYHMMQFQTAFTHPEAENKSQIASYAATIHSYISSNGAVLFGYAWEKTGEVAAGAHIVIAIDSEYDSVNQTYNLTVVDVNSPGRESFIVIDLSKESPTANNGGEALNLKRIGYYPPSSYAFLDSFDLDGAYNDMDYTKNAYTGASYNSALDIYTANEDAILITPYTNCVVTNAEGEKLLISDGTISGDMEVEHSRIIVNGNNGSAELMTIVKDSDAFIISDAIDETISFTAITSRYAGSVAGDNIDSVSISMNEKTVEISGEEMTYSVFTSADTGRYDYVVLKGYNPKSFLIKAEQETVVFHGLCDYQSVNFVSAGGVASMTYKCKFDAMNGIAIYTDNEALRIEKAESK